MYSRIISDLDKASVVVKELHGPGVVAVTLAGGRIVALAFSKDEPNLLWTHPDLGDAALVRANGLVGGIGGDRLWFSPELRYHWIGMPDWRGHPKPLTGADVTDLVAWLASQRESLLTLLNH